METLRYADVRALTVELLNGLEVEDCGLQSMPDVSPPKWHLAHTTWFFETFVLCPHIRSYRQFDSRFQELFNSYYVGVGPRHPRPERGNLSRPTLREVLAYRTHVDRAIERADLAGAPRERLELGLHHEQQHQELLVMDVKFSFAQNPILPAHRHRQMPCSAAPPPLSFERFEAGVYSLGHQTEGFCFDNELPAHRCFLEPFALANRLITNREMLAFVEDGGYDDARFWLSDGWDWAREHHIRSPLYWREDADGNYYEYTCHGEAPLDLDAPVCHVSGFEAAAFAEWMGARLPTEAEWEVAARSVTSSAGAVVSDQSLHSGVWHPRGAAQVSGLQQMFGNLWQWTRSAYEPYPGFRPSDGAISEYNGKFMCNQWVLRGSSCVTPRGHGRVSYRNFFYPHQRWPFTGIRLAQSLPKEVGPK